MEAAARIAAFAYLLSLAACDPPYYTAVAFFANTTRKPVHVRVSTLKAQLSCGDVLGRSAEVLRRSAFEPEATYVVGPGEALPLTNLDTAMNATSVNTFNGGCGAVVLSILGQPDLRVFWQPGLGSAETSKHANLADERFLAQSVRLEGGAGLERLAVGDALEGSEMPPFEPEPDEPARLFGWSGLANGAGSMIVRRDLLPDGCLAVELETNVFRSTLYLCVPDWAFPFEVGDQLNVSAPGTASTDNPSSPPNARRLIVSGLGASAGTNLEIWLDAYPPVVPSEILPTNGQGHFTSCGAYVTPVRVRVGPVGGSSVATFFETGELEDVTVGTTRTRRLYGRAERVVVAPYDCEPGRSGLQSYFDLLTLMEEQP